MTLKSFSLRPAVPAVLFLLLVALLVASEHFGSFLVLGSPAEPAATRTIRAVDVSATAGQQVVVSVELVSLGDEAAASFTVNFDPTKLSDPFVTLGSGAPASASIGTNLSQSLNGRVGVLLDSAAPFSAGDRQMFTVRFNVAANAAAGPTTISFGGTPTTQSVTTALGTPLTTTYQSGNVTITNGSAVSNGKIAFERFSDSAGVLQIYSVSDSAGATASVLCGGTSESRRPAFSHDGQKLAFVRDGTIWTANADCTNQVSRNVTGDNPTWSPQGDFIAFTQSSGFTDLFVIPVVPDGQGAIKLTNSTLETNPNGSFSNGQPSWGSNGKIAFRALSRKIVNGNLASVGDIWTVEGPGLTSVSGTRTFTRLTDDPVNAYAPDWSPASSKIAFSSNRATNRGEIFTMNPDGTNQTRITNNASISNSNPAWSPDGLKIVHDDDFSNITTRNADGASGAARSLGNFPDWQQSTGSPTPSPTPNQADVRISSIQDSPDPVLLSETVVYRIFVNNAGPAVATNVLVGTDPLPASVEFSPAQSSPFCNISADRAVGCALPSSLPASGTGSIVPVDVAVIARTTGTISFAAVVSANQPDPNSSNNRATAQTTVTLPQADLNVSFTDLSTANPSVDRELSYKALLKNLGPSTSSGTFLRIQIPSNTFLVTPLAGCARIGNGRNYDCAIGSMASGSERSFDVRVRPTAPGPITLFAEARSTSPDSTPADREASRQLQVTDVPRPSNDDLANATPITGENVNINGSNVNATIERANPIIDALGETTHAGKAAGKSVWYLWQAPNRRGSVKVSTAGSSFDTLLDVRELNGTPLPVVASNDDAPSAVTSELSFRYTPGAAYYIAVDGYGGASGDITLKVNVTPFIFLSDPINQKITGFSPAAACSSVSDLNDLFCGYKREPGTGFLLLTIRGENFIPASKVLVDGRPPQGFDLNGTPVVGETTFISSSELLVRVPPNPPLLVERIAKAGVVTTVDITTGLPAENAPTGTAQAVAGQTAQIKVLDLKNATLAPGETAEICGATLFNDPEVETCMTMVHFGPGSTTVSPTWFAALAYCDGVETNTDRRLQCAESMTNGRGWAVNPRPGATPLGSIRFNTTIEVPYGIAPPAGIAPQILGTGGMPAGLITDCSYCAALVGQDGGTLIGQDGSTLIGQDGSTLIGNDGSTLIGNDGSTLIGNDGSTLIGLDGGSLIGNDGSTRPDLFGPNLMRRNALTGQGPTRPALPRSPADLATGNTGFTVIKGSGGSQPTVTYTADEVTGKAYVTVSITLDNTSTPRAANVGNMSFTVGLNPGVLKLQSSTVTVNENAGVATVTVLRTGDTSRAASFEYTTIQNSEVTSCVPGSTSGNGGEKCDFSATLGAVRFEANETSKEIRIPIVDDAYAEGTETFKLIIGNALGAAIDLPSAATISILDNDTVNGPANPLDNSDAQFFVRQQYLDLLGREPTPGEITDGTGPIVQCGADAACRKTKSVDLSHALFLRAQPAWGYVFRLYRAAFGNEQPFPIPDTANLAEAKKWISYSAFSRDLALLTDGQDLAQKQVELANSFVLRRAFTEKYSPVTLINGPAFVDAVLATIRSDIGVELVSQRALLISAFDNAPNLMEGRAAVMHHIANASQANPINNLPFVTAEENRAFSSMLHTGYLKRDGDLTGLSTVVSQLQSGSPQRGFIDQFVSGMEYRLRFGPTANISVTVSGRVLTPTGQALRNAVVTLISQEGNRQTATTSSFGLFSFANVPNGASYTVTIASKRFRFTPRQVQVNGNLALGDLVGLE